MGGLDTECSLKINIQYHSVLSSSACRLHNQDWKHWGELETLGTLLSLCFHFNLLLTNDYDVADLGQEACVYPMAATDYLKVS